MDGKGKNIKHAIQLMKRCFKSILDLVLNRIFFVTKITSTVWIGITLAINCNSGRARLGDNTFNNNMLYQ